jgi:transposase-like protein
MKGNLGDNKLRRRRRRGDPMRVYDGLPAPVRRWLAEAQMPWSPETCRRIYLRAKRRGETIEAVLERLDRAEQQTLDREQAARGAPSSQNCARAKLQ